MLLPSTVQAGALVVAERIREAMRAEVVPFEGREISFTVSIGLAQFDPDCATAAELIARADRALYAAKRSGRDCVRCHGEPGVANLAPPATEGLSDA